MSEATKAALAKAEEQLALAKKAVAESTAKRDEAQAALEAIEQKRRGLARAFFLGSSSDFKSARTAANARNDAQMLVEDVNLVLDEAQRFAANAAGMLMRVKFKDHWEIALELGRRRAEELEKIVAARDAMYAAIAEYREIGQKIIPHIGRAKMLYPYGAAGVDPDRVYGVVGGDREKLAAIIVDGMPQDMFMALSNTRGRPLTDAVERERAFWEENEIQECEAAPEEEAA